MDRLVERKLWNAGLVALTPHLAKRSASARLSNTPRLITRTPTSLSKFVVPACAHFTSH